MASSLAFLVPYFRTEKTFRATTYGSGLQVAFQKIHTFPARRSTILCTPTMLVAPNPARREKADEGFE